MIGKRAGRLCVLSPSSSRTFVRVLLPLRPPLARCFLLLWRQVLPPEAHPKVPSSVCLSVCRPTASGVLQSPVFTKQPGSIVYPVESAERSREVVFSCEAQGTPPPSYRLVTASLVDFFGNGNI